MQPRQGQSLIMTGGWENPHYVDAVKSGTRYAIPTFFNTLSPDPPLSPAFRESELCRARAVFAGAVRPESPEVFLNFCQHWGSLLS